MNTTLARITLRGLVAVALLGSFGLVQSQTFIHPGALSTSADFARMTAKVNANVQPWLNGWNKLLANSHSSSTYALRGPVDTVYRGTGSPENYSKLYNDIAAVYQNSLRWRIKGDGRVRQQGGGDHGRVVRHADEHSRQCGSVARRRHLWLRIRVRGREYARLRRLVCGELYPVPKHDEERVLSDESRFPRPAQRRLHHQLLGELGSMQHRFDHRDRGAL